MYLFLMMVYKKVKTPQIWQNFGTFSDKLWTFYSACVLSQFATFYFDIGAHLDINITIGQMCDVSPSAQWVISANVRRTAAPVYYVT